MNEQKILTPELEARVHQAWITLCRAMAAASW